MTLRGAPEESGFTLIEMLVALAVFSIAAMALLRLDAFAVASTTDLSGRAMAALVASNEVALIQSDPGAVVMGSTNQTVANGGRTFEVRRTLTATADRRLVRVDIHVVDQASDARSTLTAIKRVR
jgi:general secretion pathway protein I